jgi:phosphoenolpyruvate phosphomutase
MKKKRIFFNLKRPYVFVPMTLDYFHHGHVNILKIARKYGNIILGLMTDKAIKSYKKSNPENSFTKRKNIALMLKDVKHIISVKGPNYYPILAKKYKFDYVIHGDDWKKGPQAEGRNKLIMIMKNWKGKVLDVPYTKGISSTKIKAKR